ncbi:MAG: hypothetical protein ACKN9W_03930 [Methylococcus sp.]
MLLELLGLRKNIAQYRVRPLFSRRAIWAGKYFVNVKTDCDRVELSRRDLDALLEQLAAVA